jgi:hypothetical protein
MSSILLSEVGLARALEAAHPVQLQPMRFTDPLHVRKDKPVVFAMAQPVQCVAGGSAQVGAMTRCHRGVRR